MDVSNQVHLKGKQDPLQEGERAKACGREDQ